METITKEELRKKIDDVKEGRMSQTDFLRFCAQHEEDVLRHCDSGTERRVIKHSLRLAKRMRVV